MEDLGINMIKIIVLNFQRINTNILKSKPDGGGTHL